MSEGPAARPPTSFDVARLAGCSQASVSLWMTGKFVGRLSPELQARIAEAVARLGYTTNRTAQRLSHGTAKTATFFFPGFSYDYFGAILDGVSKALGRDWELNFVDSRPNDSRRAPESIFTSSVGADTTAVLVASPSAADLAALALINGPRKVVVDAPESPDNAALVTFDMEPAVDRMTEHLVALGHRTVGYVGLAAPSLTLSHREHLVRAACIRHRVRLVPSPPLSGSFDATGAAGDLLRAWTEEDVSAVICADERIAYFLLKCAQRGNVRIPDDISLVAFNDSNAAALLNPSLASIRLPPDELGHQAGNLIKTSMHRPGAIAKIATKYMPRDSVARAPLHLR